MNPQRKPLFNPLSSDLRVEFKDDDNVETILVMPALEISYFEGYQYDFMKKHMAETIYNERGQRHNHTLDIEEINKEIEHGGD